MARDSQRMPRRRAMWRGTALFSLLPRGVARPYPAILRPTVPAHLASRRDRTRPHRLDQPFARAFATSFERFAWVIGGPDKGLIGDALARPRECADYSIDAIERTGRAIGINHCAVGRYSAAPRRLSVGYHA